MKEQALVMFDWDGVIVDSLDMFTTYFVAACHENGFTDIRSEKEFLALFEDNVYKAMEGYGADISTINKILKSYGEKTKNAIESLKLFDGMAEALKRIAAENRIFIITSNISSIPQKVLHRYEINCVEDVIGAEKEKSKVKKIEKLVAEYPSLIPWYVGDTKGDIIEGKQSGTRTVGISWGWHGAEKLKECSPDYIAYYPNELADILCG